MGTCAPDERVKGLEPLTSTVAIASHSTLIGLSAFLMRSRAEKWCHLCHVFLRFSVHGTEVGEGGETQPGEAGAWPGRVDLRELVKWRGVSSLEQRLV